MATFDALDNPIWESLTSIHANMAQSNGSARRYASQVSPAAAVSKPTPTAFSDLAALMKVEEQVGLFTAEPLHVGDEWETVRTRPIEQMICTENKRHKLAAGAVGPCYFRRRWAKESLDYC